MRDWVYRRNIRPTQPAYRYVCYQGPQTIITSRLAGHYPCLKLGPPWWFQDSIEGMARFRQLVTETSGIYNTVGFNDDTRAFPSIPARHDLARRVDCNFLAGLVARHVIDMSDAQSMSKALAYDLVKQAYKL